MKIRTALILAGGKGLRLRSVTKGKYPKPLVMVSKHKTLLQYTIDSLLNSGIQNIYISVGHQRNHILKSYLKSNMKFVIENKALGTGGAIVNFIDQMKIKEPFVVVPADNVLEWKQVNFKKNLPDNILGKSVAVWYASGFKGGNWQSSVSGNIIRNIKTGEMLEYLSSVSIEDRQDVYYKRAKDNLTEVLSSLGVVIINPTKYIKSVRLLNLGESFCLYKDLCAKWIYGDVKYNVHVLRLDLELIDVGTPERLKLIRSRFGYIS